MPARRSKTDPTGQARNRKRSAKRLQRRLRQAEAQVKARFRKIPRRRRTVAPAVNAETVVYSYDISAEELAAMQGEIRATLDTELETEGERIPRDWFWRQEIEQPYRQGTAEELINFNQLVAGAAVAGILVRGMEPQPVPIEAFLGSRGYRIRQSVMYVRNYGTIKTLSQRTADQVIQRINAGLQAGSTPTQIADDIAERFDVAKSSAKRIADTEINQAYNDGRLEAVEQAATQTGLRAGVIHHSALLPTTRDEHAARHGNAYSPEDQTKWWNSGSNRINCYCSIESVLLDDEGRVIQAERQERIYRDRRFFE